MDVYITARELDPHISLGTVYRNLSELANLGEIKKLTMPDKSDRFDWATHEHHHVLCNKCHAVFDIDIALTRRLSDKIKRSTGVILDDLQLVGTGVCKHCLNDNLTKRRNYARIKRH
jgi:Fe2+ or Zn2+ uptake regulation protein